MSTPRLQPRKTEPGRVEPSVDETSRPGHELVRETWSAAAADDRVWRKVLHDGVADAAAAPADGGIPPAPPHVPLAPST